MSHCHCEIVIPPSSNIEKSVASVLKKFDENGKDEDGERNTHAFWDFFVIGGRWAGAKEIARYDTAKLEAFYAWLKAEKVTVHGLTAGKQEISPADQIPKVDAKWNEMFPTGAFVPCPIFKHSNDQYAKRGPMSGALPADVCRLVDVPPEMEVSRVIFTQPSMIKVGSEYEHKGPLEAAWMITEDFWNGVTHVKSAWDKKMPSALALYRETLSRYNPTYAETVIPTDDWLSVTVDYHS